MNVHVSYKVQKTPDLEKEINHQIEKLQEAPPGLSPGTGASERRFWSRTRRARELTFL